MARTAGSQEANDKDERVHKRLATKSGAGPSSGQTARKSTGHRMPIGKKSVVHVRGGRDRHGESVSGTDNEREPSRSPTKRLPIAKKEPRSGASNKKSYKPGVLALKQIRQMQKSTQRMIPRAAFGRLARDYARTASGNDDLRWRPEALHVLQEAAETFLVGLMEDTNLLAVHARRVTIRDVDMRLALRIRGQRSMLRKVHAATSGTTKSGKGKGKE